MKHLIILTFAASLSAADPVPTGKISPAVQTISDSKADDPRIAVAQNVIALKDAEIEAKDAEIAYLKAQIKKMEYYLALEAAKRLLPGWYDKALLTPEFRIAPKPEEKK